ARQFKVKKDRLHVIYNGIDLDEYRPVKSKDALRKFGIDSEKPYLLFVGRITRQKGIIHLVRAIEFMDKNFQVVLCAGAPDTPEIAQEMKSAVEQARRARDGNENQRTDAGRKVTHALWQSGQVESGKEV